MISYYTLQRYYPCFSWEPPIHHPPAMAPPSDRQATHVIRDIEVRGQGLRGGSTF